MLEASIDGRKYILPDVPWRIESLFTKEPATTVWLAELEPEDVLWDVGANIGLYSLLACARGARVLAFEPESQNYAALNQLVAMNRLPIQPYCVALGHKNAFSTLFLSKLQLGGSCHSLGEEVGFNLQPRVAAHRQPVLSARADWLLSSGFPQPTHVKIDVDGFEYYVVEGFGDCLQAVRSLIIETNPALPEHLGMMDSLREHFFYDHAQFAAAQRPEGTFKGVGECIWTRSNAVLEHVLRAVESTPLEEQPTPHIFVENLLPDSYFRRLKQNFPTNMIPLSETGRTTGYKERHCVLYTDLDRLNDVERRFWRKSKDWLYAPALRTALAVKFNLEEQGSPDALVVEDQPGYKIGPHTDVQARLWSMLMYIEGDYTEGTQFYRHKGDRPSDGTRHGDFSEFELAKAMPFKPNSALIFPRTDFSYHGVPPTGEKRRLLIFNARKQ